MRLAEVGLHRLLLLRRQARCNLRQVQICDLDKRLDAVHDPGRGRSLQGLGLKGLGNELEGFGGLIENSGVLSGGIVSCL